MKTLNRGLLWFVTTIILSVVSADAQLKFSGQVYIPFDFSIGSKLYRAGHYKVKAREDQDLHAIFTLENRETLDWNQMAFVRTGSRTEGAMTVMNFSRFGTRNVLLDIVSTNFGFRPTRTKVKNLVSRKNEASRDKIVSILITPSSGSAQ